MLFHSFESALEGNLDSSPPTGAPTKRYRPTAIPSRSPTAPSPLPTQSPSAPPKSPSSTPTRSPTTTTAAFPVSLMQHHSLRTIQLVGLSFYYQQEIQVLNILFELNSNIIFKKKHYFLLLLENFVYESDIGNISTCFAK